MGRLADKVSLPSLYYSPEELEENIVPREERDAQPLALKIEALLNRFMDRVVPWDKVMKYYKRKPDSFFNRAGKI